MAAPFINKCPNCNSELERGYLSFLSYLKWCTNKPRWWHGFEGKLVAGRNIFMMNRSTEGLRCKRCNILIFKSDYA
jgi:hypothetical protein